MFLRKAKRNLALWPCNSTLVVNTTNKWMNQFNSVARWCPTLCDPMDCSTPGLPVLHQLPEFTQTHVMWWHQWCHPAISSSVVPFSSHLQSLPASGSFPMSQFFVSGGQSIGVLASASVLPMKIQDWFPLAYAHLKHIYNCINSEVNSEGKNGNLPQYSCLGNPMDRGTWRAAVLGLQELDTTGWLNNKKTQGKPGMTG